MTSLTLYTNPMSRGRIARWMLEEIGQPYETQILQYGPEMSTPDYLAINPMAKVPAVKHGETVITENGAICAYLAETFPEAGLAPTAEERGAFFRWLFFAAGPVDQAISNTSFSVDTSDPEVAGRFGYGSMDRVVATLSGLLSANDYVCGSRFTAADVMLGSAVSWGMMFKCIPEDPALRAYVDRVTDRPAFARAKEIDDALLAGTDRQ